MSIIQNQHEYQDCLYIPQTFPFLEMWKNQEHYSIISTLGLLHCFILITRRAGKNR